jgi:chromosome segregation ATPase
MDLDALRTEIEVSRRSYEGLVDRIAEGEKARSKVDVEIRGLVEERRLLINQMTEMQLRMEHEGGEHKAELAEREATFRQHKSQAIKALEEDRSLFEFSCAEREAKMKADFDAKEREIAMREAEWERLKKLDVQELEKKRLEGRVEFERSKAEIESMIQASDRHAKDVQSWIEKEEGRLHSLRSKVEGDEQRLAELAMELHEREGHVTNLEGKLLADLDLAQVMIRSDDNALSLYGL